MKRICDMGPGKEIMLGKTRVRSFTNYNLLGTIMRLEIVGDENRFTIYWDDKTESSFMGNKCECEVVEDKK